jgi:hypothetical protein
MAASVTITLDTTAPATPAIVIAGGAAATTSQDVTAAITTADGANPAGYQVKIWGSVDPAFNASIQATEGASAWISMASPHAIRLSATDGVKTVSARIRDDVLNETAVVTDTITLDTSAPVPTVGAPSPAKISKMATKNVSTITWSADAIFEEYKIKVVSASGDANTAGTQIPTTNGSTNMSGTAGAYPAATNITSTINGADLEAASAGDGAKVVKVFVRDAAGNWSV